MRATTSKPPSTEQIDLAGSAMSAFTLGLDQSSTPLIVLSAEGLVRHVIPAAAYMMGRSPLLDIRDCRLYVRRADDRKALTEALNSFAPAVVLGRPAEPRLVVLRNRESRPVMCLLLSQLSGTQIPQLIIVRIADLITPSQAKPDWLMRIFDLTPAQARVGSALMDGLDLRAIADQDRTALETVRGHLKRAMAKTTARSQAQFVRLLLRAYETLSVPVAAKALPPSERP